jgi:hypothetical protein
MRSIIFLGWAGLGWAGLGWAGLGWAGLGWAGLGWAGLGWAGLGWAGISAVSGHVKVACMHAWHTFDSTSMLLLQASKRASAPPVLHCSGFLGGQVVSAACSRLQNTEFCSAAAAGPQHQVVCSQLARRGGDGGDGGAGGGGVGAGGGLQGKAVAKILQM